MVLENGKYDVIPKILVPILLSGIKSIASLLLDVRNVSVSGGDEVGEVSICIT